MKTPHVPHITESKMPHLSHTKGKDGTFLFRPLRSPQNVSVCFSSVLHPRQASLYN